eukprot:5247771-Amphidinium_carterae.1
MLVGWCRSTSSNNFRMLQDVATCEESFKRKHGVLLMQAPLQLAVVLALHKETSRIGSLFHN